MHTLYKTTIFAIFKLTKVKQMWNEKELTSQLNLQHFTASEATNEKSRRYLDSSGSRVARNCLFKK